ncbi:MAG: SDR family oxidoreductase [Anaerolineales bacterium]|nr:SDR family oxidoreductase [Anaerolineales bacterium]
MAKLILVTGATGYIASLLIPRLLDSGRRVRTMARHPLRLKGRNWFHYVENIPADVMTPSTLAPALHGVDTAYYLIHSMASGQGYTEREIAGARAFASAAEVAGVKHIIYLGGLADPEGHISPHMLSRIETGAALRHGRVPVTEFRASVIIGSGSISFEMIRFMTELLPIVPGPAWINNNSQPIAVQNVIDYLMAALDNPNGSGQVFEIGGPEIAQYKDLMMRYARLRGLKRRVLVVSYIPLWFMSFGVGLMTPVPRPIAHALIGGLSHHSIVKHDKVLRVFPEVKLVSFDEAIQIALARLSPRHIERVWDDDEGHTKTLKHEGFFIDYRKIKVSAEPEKVFNVITKFADHFGTRQFTVDTVEPDHLLLLRSQLKTPGEGWIEWQVSRIVNSTYLTQTVFFAPRGTAGFLYWYLLSPFRAIIFYWLIKNIARNSMVE